MSIFCETKEAYRAKQKRRKIPLIFTVFFTKMELGTHPKREFKRKYSPECRSWWVSWWVVKVNAILLMAKTFFFQIEYIFHVVIR